MKKEPDLGSFFFTLILKCTEKVYFFCADYLKFDILIK
jgi:hypothetical protein